LNGDLLETEAKIPAGDATMTFQRRGDPLDGGRRDHQDALTRPKHGHPERLTAGVKREPPFGLPPHDEAKLKPRVDFTAAQATPWATRAGHHSDGCGRCAVRSADH
jgi:hypothetical protein